jgi:hypothetical protein
MKLLGDDCWWAPRWMKRLQERLGLGETELPDERRRPAVRAPEEALVGAGAPVPPPSARPRPPHDPTHPGVEGASRPVSRATAPRTNAPSSTGTTRMPSGRPTADEPETTKLSTAKRAVRNAVSNAAAATRAAAAPPAPPPQAPREEREIESWLGELRGTNAPAGPSTPPPANRPPTEGRGRPSTEPTRAMPVGTPPEGRGATGGRRRQPQPGPSNEPPTTAMPSLGSPPEGGGRPQADDADATTAIPAQKPQDPETATDKLNTRDEGEKPKRRGGGMSAQDLLRREGRL